MGHGGKRPGAGRPRSLTVEQCIWVAHQYRSLIKEMLDKRKWVKKSEHPDLLKLYSKLNAYEDSKRAAWLSDPKPVGQRGGKVDQTLHDVRVYFEVDLRNDTRIDIRRRKKFRVTLLRQVAEEATVRFGVNVTPRRVETCLEEWTQEFGPQPDDLSEEQWGYVVEHCRSLVERMPGKEGDVTVAERSELLKLVAEEATGWFGVDVTPQGVAARLEKWMQGLAPQGGTPDDPS